ncbi:MAG: hypothetical protein MUC39_03845 [Candidatus Omnitrophica bacterium]|jgi:CxxC-x17-CxxC domain-containing protein|nr:hypothetical protein [Candidatus Omnitrophota bacterium]
MKKTIKRKSVSVEPRVEPQAESDIASLINRMQQQIIGLEKKIDTLISQSSARPSGGSDFPKPFRRFDKSQRFGRGGRENSFRERSFTKAICADCKTECEVPFKPTGDRPVYCKECFAKHREGGGARGGRDFGERDNRRPEGRKKPAFRKRREHA